MIKQKSNSKIKIERILGIILLIPPVIGVVLFIINLFVGKIPELTNLSVYSETIIARVYWAGILGKDMDAFISTTPIYLGLMAIAGAVLIKGTD